MQFDLKTIQRWFDKVDFTGPTQPGMDTGCWVWLAQKNREGYGRFKFAGNPLAAHRVGYEMIVGSIGDGLVADHLCVTPGCVNPHHIELVSSRVNSQRRGLNHNNTSGVRGVYWNKAAGKWHVQVGHHVGGKRQKIYGGQFTDLAAAEEAVIALRARVFGPDAEREARLEVDKARAARAEKAAA